MQAIVPAAGKGTRLRPLTDDTPKGLVEIGSQPLLSHCFDRLPECGVDEIVVVIGYRGDQIRDYYGDRYRETPLTYVTQRDRKGLAHAVLQARDHVDGEFVLLNGDNVFGDDLSDVLATHRSTAADATLLVEDADRETARETGVVVTDEDGRVTALEEKPDDPPSTLITTGCYVLPSRIMHACENIDASDRGEYELPDAIEWLLDDGADVRTVRFEGDRVNVNTPVDRDRAASMIDAGE